jgi:hypothetical protein
MLKPVSGGRKKYNNEEGSRVRCWPFFRSMERKFPAANNFDNSDLFD